MRSVADSIPSRIDTVFHSYLQGLHAYVLSFTKRTRPLNEVDKEQLAAEVEFASMWDAGQVTDWQDTKKQNGTNGGSTESSGIWCDACECFDVAPRCS